MNKYHIEQNTVQETLVIPLYGRILATEKYPFLYEDYEAEKLAEKIDYDFSKIKKEMKKPLRKFGILETAMRQYDVTAEIKKFLSKNPYGSIVNLGCGLDTLGENCDNGVCKIYNIDFPDVINLRNSLIDKNERTLNIGTDIKNCDYFDKIEKDKGVLFFATGVFYFFTKKEMIELTSNIAKYFKGVSLVFDSAGKLAVKIMNKAVIKKMGINNSDAAFYINDIKKDIHDYNIRKISARDYMLGYTDLRDNISLFYYILSNICDKFLKMKIIKFHFK